MKRWILLFVICLICQIGYSQYFGIKSNLLYDATSTINLGVEFALTDQWTLDISGNLNPWAFPQEKISKAGIVIEKYDALIKHWMLQPELRWWTCEKFMGHFFGAHVHGGQFNVGGLTFLPAGWSDGWADEKGKHQKGGLQHNRHEGWMAGVGLSYGYHWILSNRFSLEFSIGAGYAFMKYDKYIKYSEPKLTQKEIDKYKMHYFGPTKDGLSVVFMLY